MYRSKVTDHECKWKKQTFSNDNTSKESKKSKQKSRDAFQSDHRLLSRVFFSGYDCIHTSKYVRNSCECARFCHPCNIAQNSSNIITIEKIKQKRCRMESAAASNSSYHSFFYQEWKAMLNNTDPKFLANYDKMGFSGIATEICQRWKFLNFRIRHEYSQTSHDYLHRQKKEIILKTLDTKLKCINQHRIPKGVNPRTPWNSLRNACLKPMSEIHIPKRIKINTFHQ